MEPIYELSQLPFILTVEDLMPIFQIGRNSAYKLVQNKMIRAIKVGNSYRIPRDAISEFIAKNSVGGETY